MGYLLPPTGWSSSRLGPPPGLSVAGICTGRCQGVGRFTPWSPTLESQVSRCMDGGDSGDRTSRSLESPEMVTGGRDNLGDKRSWAVEMPNADAVRSRLKGHHGPRRARG